MTPAARYVSPGPLPPGIQRDRPLAPLTSWKIGGPAAYFAEPADAAALASCLAFAAEHGLPVFALGGGSNLLVSDAGYPGLVVRCGSRTWKVEPGTEGAVVRAGARGPEATAVRVRADGPEVAVVHAGARAPLAAVARGTAEAGWAGLEWAEGIPGTIGGAVIGNAGAFGGEIAAVLLRASCYSRAQGEHMRHAADMAYRYRGSALGDAPAGSCFLLAVELTLTRGDATELQARVRDYGARRRAHTPAGTSCGSVFKNPPGDSAGRLIEAAGLKGAEEGAAIVSPLHANYIINRGGATARDVLALIDRIRRTVLEQSGVTLELEVRLV